MAGYATLAAIGMLAALASGRPTFAALAMPFALSLAVATTASRRPQLRVGFTLDETRTLEGSTVSAHVDVQADVAAEWVELELLLPAGARFVEGPGRVAFLLDEGERRCLDYELVCERWGAYRIGLVDLRVRGAFGLLSHTAHIDERLALRAYPQRERLRRVVQAHETTPFSGSQVSRAKGEGIEFADIRPFAPGDRVRRVNWRASARRQRMYVSESHPERSSDAILFLDSFAEARGVSEGTIDQAVRAASSLADAYLEQRNRVGLVSFGGILRWLHPSMGMRQHYRIVDALIETELARSYAWKNVDVIPRRVLPPQALVIALTPLLDQRTINALLDLRARGFDLAVIDLDPLGWTRGFSVHDVTLTRLCRASHSRVKVTPNGHGAGRWRRSHRVAAGSASGFQVVEGEALGAFAAVGVAEGGEGAVIEAFAGGEPRPRGQGDPLAELR